MNNVIETMLSRYLCHSHKDYENALKEIIQEVALLGLWRAKFFEKAAFYGGTALRILYGLDRFSEDLDFSLLKPDKKFQLERYLASVQAELASLGFNVTLDSKTKITPTAIQSAFIKAGTKEHFLKIDVPEHIRQSTHGMKLLTVKIEIDIDPPPAFETEAKLLLQPIPFMVHSYQPPDLFAGKLHAILCRQWNGRVKGRDWYDLAWYVSHHIPLRIKHLQKRLEQTDAWPKKKILKLSDLVELLTNKIDQINFTTAKKEVMPFLKDLASVQDWSQVFFKEIIAKLKVV
jgi:predicted nucleotidyltransferase component of viral defense system